MDKASIHIQMAPSMKGSGIMEISKGKANKPGLMVIRIRGNGKMTANMD